MGHFSSFGRKLVRGWGPFLTSHSNERGVTGVRKWHSVVSSDVMVWKIIGVLDVQILHSWCELLMGRWVSKYHK